MRNHHRILYCKGDLKDLCGILFTLLTKTPANQATAERIRQQRGITELTKGILLAALAEDAQPFQTPEALIEALEGALQVAVMPPVRSRPGIPVWLVVVVSGLLMMVVILVGMALVINNFGQVPAASTTVRTGSPIIIQSVGGSNTSPSDPVVAPVTPISSTTATAHMVQHVTPSIILSPTSLFFTVTPEPSTVEPTIALPLPDPTALANYQTTIAFEQTALSQADTAIAASWTATAVVPTSTATRMPSPIPVFKYEHSVERQDSFGSTGRIESCVIGRIIDRNGNGVNAAQLTIGDGRSASRTTTSGNGGQYQFCELYGSEWQIVLDWVPTRAIGVKVTVRVNGAAGERAVVNFVERQQP
ncbi:MAG: hypothetical protein HC822_02015 [Oscillochloris sp.]|nr:hypothetical protein [Oscillochloris sp.]